jgi:hypothetical protein
LKVDGYKVWGKGLQVLGSGFKVELRNRNRVWGLGVRARGLGFRVQNLGFRV